MRRGRRIYYDLFSRFYDGFVSLHSRDKQGAARKFLVNLVPKGTAAVLDLCTGTGTILPLLQNRLGTRGRVVGADFSRGMLQVASTNQRFSPDRIGRMRRLAPAVSQRDL